MRLVHPGEQQGGAGSGLRRGVLGLRDSFAESFALLSLALASSLATTAVAGDAGAGAPLAYALAGAGSLCLASVIIRFTRRMASAGGVYTYIARGLHPSAGFIGGWLYGMGFAAGISFVMVIAGTYLSTVLEQHAHIHLGWFPCFWILLAALVAIAFLDIRISTRIQLVVAAIGALAIIAAMLTILAKGGDDGVSLQPFNPANVPNTHGFFLSMVFAFTGFIGFEAASSLGEEATQPLRVIARAVLAAVLVGLVFYVFVTFSMSIGFGIAHAAAWGKDPTALDTLATRYSGNALAIIVDLAVVVDSFVAALAGVHLTTRITFAMGKDGGLPRIFAWTHPRFRTPWFGIAGSLLLTIFLVVWLAYATYDPFTYFGFMATTASLGILFAYILVALGGIVYFWRERRAGDTRYNPILDLLLPCGAIVICGLTIYWSNVPRPPHPIDLAPWISAGWFVVGLIVLAILSARSPGRVRAFGRHLAEADLGPLEAGEASADGAARS